MRRVMSVTLGSPGCARDSMAFRGGCITSAEAPQQSAVPENGLQVFGDLVLAPLEQHADGAADAARHMVAALRERDWEGDDVLADQLDASLGSGAMPDLRPL